MKLRAFISEPRCIYTGKKLDPNDVNLKPSHEHILPLSLGGVDSFVTDDVSAIANSLASTQIDDYVASLLPFLILRQKYGLVGHRKVVPKWTLKGSFDDVQANAELSIAADGQIMCKFDDEQKTTGKLIELGSTEDRVRFFLKNRLVQAQKHGQFLLTEYGEIKDAEDIEIALFVAERRNAQNFRARISIDLKDYRFAVARLMIKVALGLGHKILGSEWTFGPGGHSLRALLFQKPDAPVRNDLHGTIVPAEKMAANLRQLLRLRSDHHTLAVLPVGKGTFAFIALFGGDAGIAVIDLGTDQRQRFRKALRTNAPSIPFLYEIALVKPRKLTVYDFATVANAGAVAGLVNYPMPVHMLQEG